MSIDGACNQGSANPRIDSSPLVSVIVPVYNVEAFLEKCVCSIRTQTYSNLDIILVNDGSSDNSKEMCDNFAIQDRRIRVFHKENGGSSSARNLGLENALGEYIGFVDSDDYIDNKMYERLVSAVLNHNCLAAQVGRAEESEDGDALPQICTPPKTECLIKDTDFLRELLLHRGDASFCTKIFHKDLFQGNTFPVGKLNEDFRLLSEILPIIKTLVSLPDIMYHVCYRKGSNTRKESADDFSRVYGDNIDNADWVNDIVRNKYPVLLKEAKRFGFFQRLEYLLHIPISGMTKTNTAYRNCVSHIRKHLISIITSPYLTLKNKAYLLMFAAAPKGIRKIHKSFKRKASY